MCGQNPWSQVPGGSDAVRVSGLAEQETTGLPGVTAADGGTGKRKGGVRPSITAEGGPAPPSPGRGSGLDGAGGWVGADWGPWGVLALPTESPVSQLLPFSGADLTDTGWGRGVLGGQSGGGLFTAPRPSKEVSPEAPSPRGETWLRSPTEAVRQVGTDGGLGS